MKKLFGGLKMSWLTVILFGVATGVYTGIMGSIPATYGTSFRDICISYEWWVLFAVIVVVNCQKSWEVALKCFVFFLVSQPLVYITEILLGSLDANMGWYYYRYIWGPITLLTLPGGFIAYFCKKQNVLGAIILGLGNAIVLLLGAGYLSHAVSNFPYHLLSGIYCLVAVYLMTFNIHEIKKNRIIAIVVPVVLAGVVLVLLILGGRQLF